MRRTKNIRDVWFWNAFLIIGLLVLVSVLAYKVMSRRDDGTMITASSELHYFVGNVGGVGIHMSILIEGADVKGLYYYDSQRRSGNSLSLKIRGNKNGNRIQLTETCDGITTGWFDGSWASGAFKGSFTREKDGKVFDFNLFETRGEVGFFTESEIRF